MKKKKAKTKKVVKMLQRFLSQQMKVKLKSLLQQVRQRQLLQALQQKVPQQKNLLFLR